MHSNTTTTEHFMLSRTNLLRPPPRQNPSFDARMVHPHRKTNGTLYFNSTESDEALACSSELKTHSLLAWNHHQASGLNETAM